MTIFINGRPFKAYPGKSIPYERLCKFANVDPAHNPTVAWASMSSQGTVTIGQSAPQEDGMVYNVTITGGA